MNWYLICIFVFNLMSLFFILLGFLWDFIALLLLYLIANIVFCNIRSYVRLVVSYKFIVCLLINGLRLISYWLFITIIYFCFCNKLFAKSIYYFFRPFYLYRNSLCWCFSWCASIIIQHNIFECQWVCFVMFRFNDYIS